jgi:hypothetical protein
MGLKSKGRRNNKGKQTNEERKVNKGEMTIGFERALGLGGDKVKRIEEGKVWFRSERFWYKDENRGISGYERRNEKVIKGR